MDHVLDYQLVEQVGEQSATVEFDGIFEQRPVRWLATIVTLAQEARTRSKTARRSFIEIDPDGENAQGRWPVRVGLAVAAIDIPTIQKTIIMIRQYRRLRRGHFEFGPLTADPQAGQL